MNMDMSCAVLNGVAHSYVPLKPLVQIARLSNVDGNPTAILGLSGIDEIARQRLESSIDGMNFVKIRLPGLAGPIGERRNRALNLMATTK